MLGISYFYCSKVQKCTVEHHNLFVRCLDDVTPFCNLIGRSEIWPRRTKIEYAFHQTLFPRAIERLGTWLFTLALQLQCCTLKSGRCVPLKSWEWPRDTSWCSQFLGWQMLFWRQVSRARKETEVWVMLKYTTLHKNAKAVRGADTNPTWFRVGEGQVKLLRYTYDPLHIVWKLHRYHVSCRPKKFHNLRVLILNGGGWIHPRPSKIPLHWRIVQLDSVCTTCMLHYGR
jgi:hypothetical protein